MSKQKDIFYILQDVRLGELSEYEAISKLEELGVVIKVDRELQLPEYFAGEWYCDEKGNKISIDDAVRYAGYAAVAPLIEEQK